MCSYSAERFPTVAGVTRARAGVVEKAEEDGRITLHTPDSILVNVPPGDERKEPTHAD